ncbi:MAG: hypothetical protein FJW63_00375 [Actinobacteria bacterium]|nr:hypothetical protein [Actinomycetota bacterium]
MGFFDDLFKSPSEKGKEDGTKQHKDFIRYSLDEGYRKGYDHGEGLRDGSESAKYPFAGPLFEDVQKIGKSDEYKRGYDRGKATYGTAGDVRPKLFGDKEKSDKGGGYSGGYGGRSSNGSGSRWLVLVCILVLIVSIIVFVFSAIIRPALRTEQEIKVIQHVFLQEVEELPFTIGLLPGFYLLKEPSFSADKVSIVKGIVAVGVYKIKGDWLMVKWKKHGTSGDEMSGWIHCSQALYPTEGLPTLEQVKWHAALIIPLRERYKTEHIEKIGKFYYAYINDAPIPDSAVFFTKEGDWIYYIDDDGCIYKRRNDGSVSTIRDAK